MLQYFPLIKIRLFHYNCIILNNYSRVVKKETLQRQDPGHNTSLGYHTDRGPMGLGQYNSLGEYCGPHTASAVLY